MLDLKHRIVCDFLVSWQILYQEDGEKCGPSFLKFHGTKPFFFSFDGVMSKREKFSCEPVAEEWIAFRTRIKQNVFLLLLPWWSFSNARQFMRRRPQGEENEQTVLLYCKAHCRFCNLLYGRAHCRFCNSYVFQPATKALKCVYCYRSVMSDWRFINVVW